MTVITKNLKSQKIKAHKIILYQLKSNVIFVQNTCGSYFVASKFVYNQGA